MGDGVERAPVVGFVEEFEDLVDEKQAVIQSCVRVCELVGLGLKP